MDEILDNMLEQGLIGHLIVNTQVILLIKKKSKGEYTLVVDYRWLNLQADKCAWPLPRTDDTLDSLSGNKLFSVIDLASGYFQIPLTKESKHKSAFCTDSLYEFNVLPQGLSSALTSFSILMQKVLKGLHGKSCVVFLDDVCVFRKTFEEKLDNLREVFTRIRHANLTLRPEKCKFFQSKVKYLGHVCQAEGISGDPTLIYQGCELPPENASSPPLQQGTPAERVLSLMDLSLPPVQSLSVSSGGRARGRGLNLLTSLQPPSTPPVGGQRKGTQHSGLTTILHTPSRGKFF